MRAEHQARRALLVVIAAAAVGAGCGDDDSGESSSSEQSSFDVIATEYAYELPDEVPGGLVTMNFVNEGDEPHEYALAKSDEEHSVEELDAAIEETIAQGGEPPGWVEDAANYGLQTSGASMSITDTLEPGSYEFLCFIPGPGKKNHLELGMKRGFVVSGDSGASAPDANGVITATAEGFEVPAVSSGEQALEVRNDGPRLTSFQLIRFEPGRDIADVEEWAGGGFQEEPPASLFGGAEVAEGESVFLGLTFESGTYELVDTETQETAEFKVD